MTFKQTVRYMDLSTIVDADIIIVTDEYPPASIGGAEISLHETVKYTDFRDRVLIVKFTSQNGKIGFYRHESVNVLVLPRSSIWNARLGEKSTKFSRSISDIHRFIDIFRKFGLSKARLASIEMSLKKKLPSGGKLRDSLPEAYEFAAEMLSRLIEQVKPKIVIANNTRSILRVFYSKQLFGACWSEIATMAMVRDNRFNCPRHSQSVMVGDQLCNPCAFECAHNDLRSLPRPQKLMLEETKAARIKALNTFDSVTVTSQYLQHHISAILADTRRLFLVPNFAGNTLEIANAIAETEEESQDDIAVIGSINEAKGQRAFIDSAKKWLRKNPNLRIKILGRGNRVKQLIEDDLAEHQDIRERVIFTGFLDRQDLYREISKSKIVALPTLWPEPFGRVPLEAALCKKPVVSFDVGGLGESIVPRKTGYLIVRGDYDGMWKEINHLLSNPGRRHELGVAAHAHILTNYSQEQTLELNTDVIRKTVTCAPKTPP